MLATMYEYILVLVAFTRIIHGLPGILFQHIKINYMKALTLVNLFLFGSTAVFSQNFGIDEPNPTEKLDVNGNIKSSTLAGSGVRPVYANSDGVLQTASGSVTVFNYTGGDQTYTVPSGVTSITVKLWGAGGGGGYRGGWSYGFSGGGGGFAKGDIAVSPGQVLTIIVGQGGHGGNVVSTAYSYGGGGRSCNTGSDCRYGGQGGGRSAIRSGSTELMTAGGGGAGGSSRCLGCTQFGGAGGGYVGQSGTSGQYNYGAGQGGLPMAGGAGGSNVSGPGGAGLQFKGGTPGSNAYGGGGGGGWYGGGGGGYNESNTMGGGGGGSGYIGGAGVSNGRMEVGDRANPGGSLDPDYVPGIGVGGITNQTAIPLYGGNGMVVIIPN